MRLLKNIILTICTFGHAGDGNLHPTCVTDARNHEEMERVEKAFAEIFEKAIELGGTITGEHGVGAMKAPYLELKLGKEGIAAMKGIKQAFDPNQHYESWKNVCQRHAKKSGDDKMTTTK